MSIIGPNGAGKTTFFNQLTGVYAPSEGTIEFEGSSIVGLSPHSVAELGIARTYQNIRLFQNMTVLDNVLVGRHVRLRAQWFEAILGLNRVKVEEETARARARELLVDRRPATPRTSRSWRRTFRTATSGGWSWPAPWPTSRSCCCSTSRPPA